VVHADLAKAAHAVCQSLAMYCFLVRSCDDELADCVRHDESLVKEDRSGCRRAHEPGREDHTDNRSEIAGRDAHVRQPTKCSSGAGDPQDRHDKPTAGELDGTFRVSNVITDVADEDDVPSAVRIFEHCFARGCLAIPGRAGHQEQPGRPRQRRKQSVVHDPSSLAMAKRVRSTIVVDFP
jgi:hypothetical protein